ncbi:MAG: carbon-nitrogen hydrolase family protein, partial [Pirellulaceae bacterium]
FVLATPTSVQTHDKDFPSGPIEHAYYAGGEDSEFVSLLDGASVNVESRNPIPSRDNSKQDGVFTLPGINVGVALCWEMIRHRTVARMLGKVDVVMASSAWPAIDPDVGFPGMSRKEVVDLNETLLAMLRDAPNRLARMLGVPVIHANLVGRQRSTKLFDQSVEMVTRFCGESRIVDGRGRTVACRSADEGEGLVVADLVLEKMSPESPESDGVWIPELHPILENLWYVQGAAGREYYLKTTQPYRSSRPRV